jgi:hypothetical protein
MAHSYGEVLTRFWAEGIFLQRILTRDCHLLSGLNNPFEDFLRDNFNDRHPVDAFSKPGVILPDGLVDEHFIPRDSPGAYVLGIGWQRGASRDRGDIHDQGAWEEIARIDRQRLWCAIDKDVISFFVFFVDSL